MFVHAHAGLPHAVEKEWPPDIPDFRTKPWRLERLGIFRIITPFGGMRLARTPVVDWFRSDDGRKDSE